MTTKTNHHLLPEHLLPRTNQFVVLVIDDMAVNRILLSKVFSASGYAVVEAENGIEAIEMVASGALLPDVIVTDVEMPEMDGISMTEVIRHLRNPAANIPIIVASGNPDSEMTASAYEAGADVFLAKPFNLKELREEVKSVITGGSARLSSNGNRRSGRAGVNQLRTRLS